MTEIVYKGFRKDELEYQYNPRESVPEYPELSKRKAEQARKVREIAKSWLNVAYGKSAREMLDIYAADRCSSISTAGIGAAATKEDNCNFVPTFTKRGATVVVVEYDLCPKVTAPTSCVRPRRRSLGFSRTSPRYGGNPSNLYVWDHSAGGRLTAIALAHNRETKGCPEQLLQFVDELMCS